MSERVKKQLLLQFSRLTLPKRNIDFMEQIKTQLSQADIPNRNNRIYRYNTMKRQNDKFFNLIKQGRGRGQLDHPQTFEVNLERVSHMFTDLWWEGKKVFGKFVILPTPLGQTFKILINNGVKIGFSSRGAGSLIQGYGDTSDIVDDDYDLVTYDAVSWPSSINAWVMYQGNKRKIIKKQSTQNHMPLLTGKEHQKYIDQMYNLLSKRGLK